MGPKFGAAHNQSVRERERHSRVNDQVNDHLSATISFEFSTGRFIEFE